MIKINQDMDSVSSSATLSCMKDSNDAAMDVEVEEKNEKAYKRLSLRLGYDWVNPKVQEYFS